MGTSFVGSRTAPTVAASVGVKSELETAALVGTRATWRASRVALIDVFETQPGALVLPCGFLSFADSIPSTKDETENEETETGCVPRRPRGSTSALLRERRGKWSMDKEMAWSTSHGSLLG